MAFRLPPFWSAGYALPKHVRVEDLQRGSFVTGWMPRGWYDAPRVGAGGYTLPDYVSSEPYGQGARVTKMMPRGSTVLPVPHWIQEPAARLVAATMASGDGTNYEIAGGTPSLSAPDSATSATGTDLFHLYGKQVADHVVTTIAKVPASQRKSAMKRLFDKIDPHLYNRVSATASKAAKAGIPPRRALHHAIATEFRSGMLRELGTLGTTKKIRRASQVGLGCYGCIALGDSSMGAWARPRAGQTPDVTCADGTVWVWNGPKPIPQTGPTGCPVVNVHKPGETRTDLPQGPAAPKPPCGTKDKSGNLIVDCDPTRKFVPYQTVTVGPFSFRTGAGVRSDNISYADPSQVPAAVKAWIQSRVDGQTKCCFGSKIGNDRSDAKPGDDNPAHYWLGYGASYYLDDGEWYTSNMTAFPAESLVDPISVNGTDYGVFLAMRGKDPNPDIMGALPAQFVVKFAPMDFRKKGIWGNITSTVGGWFSTAGNWVDDAAGAIGDAACKVLGQPGAAAAAAAASGGAAGAGAAIAAGFCAPKQPSPGTPGGAGLPTGSAGSNLMPIVLIGGLGLAALYFLKD